MAEDDTQLMTDPDELNALVAAALAEAEPADEEPTGAAAPATSDTNTAAATKIGLLSDVDLHVKVELGRTQMLVEDVLRLGDGSIVELDKLAGDPVDVYVNDQLIARGEVLVLNDNFCIRISEILANLEEQAQALVGHTQP